MRPDCPGPCAFGSGFLIPTMLLSAKATTTKASQPNVAVFQCAALQRPIRAARLPLFVRVMAVLLSARGLMGSRLP